MTTRLAITGTDGTGKSTVIRHLQHRFAEEPTRLRAFRAPQYHDNPGVPCSALSADLDAVSELADRRGHTELKATALFLQMTLFGRVERHFGNDEPTWVVSERQCLCDSLVYARFYTPLMRRDLDPDVLRPVLVEAIGVEGLARISDWVEDLPTRLGRPAGLALWDVPSFALAVFSGPDLLENLRRLYEADLPDVLVVLTASATELASRLASKAEGTPRELHEQGHVLAAFQEGLLASATSLQSRFPLTVHTIDTSGLDEAGTVSAVLSLMEV